MQTALTKKFSFKPCIALALFLVAVASGTARAASDDVEPPQLLAASTIATPSRGLESLPPAALQLAEQLGVAKDIERLLTERDAIRAGKSPTIEYVLLKQKVLESLMNASFEVRAASSRLNAEIADSDDLQAVLEDRRDRAIRLNTIANFISGGITGIIGGSFRIGDLPNASSDSIDLAEGVIQTSLASYAYKQQDGERRIMKGTPNMLATIFDLSGSEAYTDIVWKFLESRPVNAQANRTRREQLVSHWREIGIIERMKPLKERQAVSTRIQHVAGMHPQHPVTIDLLSTRSAMLHDVRAAIGQMDGLLLALLQLVRE